MAALQIIISIAACLFVGFLTGSISTLSINTWYVKIKKPSFNPPNKVFGPVWTALYVLMGVAAGMAWHQGLHRKDVLIAMCVFVVQILLNGLWSIIFFGFKSIGGALMEIIFLWIAIATCAFLFFGISTWAGWLMIPYLMWVTFALFLNYSIWQLNKSAV